MATTSSPSMIQVMQPIVDEVPSAATLSRRPASLDGLSVAFVDEGGPNADVLLARLERELADRTSLATIVRAKLHGDRIDLFEPGGALRRSIDTSGPVLNEIADWANLAVVGVGF